VWVSELEIAQGLGFPIRYNCDVLGEEWFGAWQSLVNLGLVERRLQYLRLTARGFHKARALEKEGRHAKDGFRSVAAFLSGSLCSTEDIDCETERRMKLLILPR